MEFEAGHALQRDTLCEAATCVVTETRFEVGIVSLLPYLAIGSPRCALTTLAFPDMVDKVAALYP